MTKYIYIPYADKEEAKAAGAKWDKEQKSWYIPEGVSEQNFRKWIEREDPVSLFTQDLIDNGCILSSGEPICDGKSHRITVEGDKSGEKSGFYVMHLDTIPNGYFCNNRTKSEFKKKYYNRGIYERISDADIEKNKERYMAKISAMESEKKARADDVARSLRYKLKNLPNTLTLASPYFAKKQIKGSYFTFTEISKNEDGESVITTCIPLYNVDGKITTVQYIAPNGQKRFAKNGQKNGSMHIVDGKISERDRYIIICEGYATASTLQEEVSKINNLKGKTKVVAAMDAGNISIVGRSLKSKYPDRVFIIAADNDRFSSENVGVIKAKQAAQEIGAKVIIPDFLQDVGTDYNDLKVFDNISVLEQQLQKIC